MTSVPSAYQRCPGNTRGAPVHSSSRADRPHLRLVSLPALKQHAHGDNTRSLSMRQKPISLSFSRSRQQCVTDQHHHEHRTDSPAPGYDREHCHKPVRHHHPHPWARMNKIHPPGFLIWALLVACSFPPRYTGGECEHISGRNTDKRSPGNSPFFFLYFYFSFLSPRFQAAAPPPTWMKSSNG